MMKINRKYIYVDLKSILEKVVVSVDNNKLSFDLDEEFVYLIEKHDIGFDYGLIALFYSYIDIVNDSLNHSFYTVNGGYSYQDVKEDLGYVIKKIENDQILELERDTLFLEKIERVLN